MRNNYYHVISLAARTSFGKDTSLFLSAFKLLNFLSFPMLLGKVCWNNTFVINLSQFFKHKSTEEAIIYKDFLFLQEYQKKMLDEYQMSLMVTWGNAMIYSKVLLIWQYVWKKLNQRWRWGCNIIFFHSTSVYVHPQGLCVPFQHIRQPQVDGGFDVWKPEGCTAAARPGAQKDPPGCKERQAGLACTAGRLTELSNTTAEPEGD